VNAAGAAVSDGLADRVEAFGRRRALVGVDGRTAAGKTTLSDQLAERVARRPSGRAAP
jgi:pantothenate kinase